MFNHFKKDGQKLRLCCSGLFPRETGSFSLFKTVVYLLVRRVVSRSFMVINMTSKTRVARHDILLL